MVAVRHLAEVSRLPLQPVAPALASRTRQHLPAAQADSPRSVWSLHYRRDYSRQAPVKRGAR